MQRSRQYRIQRKLLVTAAMILALVMTFIPQAIPGVEVPSAEAHNLNASVVYVFFDPDTQTFLDARINAPGWSPPQPMLQIGDELGLIIKAVPDLGTTTGVGGYTTFYVPNGLQVVDAAFLQPSDAVADGITGWDKVPVKGQARMPAVGAGGDSTVSLVGVTRGPNILGISSPIVDASNANLGTLPGVYGDTGIFYSTAPETAFGTYSGGAITNNSGDTVGIRTILGTTLNKWDAWQMAGYGIKGTTNPAYPSAAIIDSNQRGYAPWGLANVVAGPQSGYAWQFSLDTYKACTGGSTAPNAACIDQATQAMGPWQRIKYPGSQFSDDPPGNRPAVQPYTRGADASNSGFDLSTGDLALTTGQANGTPNAVRFAYGQLTYNVPEYAWIKVRVHDTAAILDTTGCPKWTVDTFGGDAGGDSGGKDHIWRYYDPNSVTFNGCVGIGKPATRELVKVGDNYQYKIKLYNMGANDFATIQIKDTLPSGVTYVSAVPAPSSVSLPYLTWNVSPFLRGQKFEATVTVTAKSSGLIPNTVCASGVATAGPAAGQTINSCGGDTTLGGNLPLLSQTKSVSPTSAAPGGSVTYQLRIQNIGTGPTGSPVEISDYLPTGFTYPGAIPGTLPATVNGASVSVSVSGAADRPVMTVPVAINAGGELVMSLPAQIGASTVAGRYCNYFATTQSGIRLTTGTLACVDVGGASIGDTVYRDWNGNGVQDPGEEGIPGIQVCANPGNICATTDASGYYLINGLTNGTYNVTVTNPPAGYTPTQTASNPYTVNQGDKITTADFGYQPGGPGAIGDQVFKDIGNDGVFNGADTGIPNITVNLYEDTNGNGVIDAGQDLLIGSDVTDGSGVYGFSNLDPTRSYIVKVDETDPDLAAAFSPNTFVASTPNPQKVTPADFTAQGNNVTDADFGYFENLPSTIGDEVFVDANGNGDFDAGDSPIPGATVELYLDGVLLRTDTTDANGNYLFGQLAAGDYTVKVVLDSSIPGGYAPTVAQYDFYLPPSTTDLDKDFPFVPLISKSVDKATANPGDTLTYQINVHYPGSELLSNVSVTDNVPAGTTYADTASPAPAVQPAIGATGVISWSLGSNTAARDGSVIPAVTLLAGQDTYINEDKPTTTYGASTTLGVDGNVSGTKRQRPLIQFDLSSVCPGAIQSADLVLVRQDGGGNADAQAVTVHRVTQSWTAGTATWTSFGAAGFATAGSDPTQTVSGNSGDVPYTWNVTDIVKSWCQIANPNPNDGFILTSSLDNNKIHLFYSMEGAPGLTPKLKINGGSPEFAAPAHVTTSLGGNDALKPAVVYDGNGVAHTVFQGKVNTTDGKINIYYSNDQGTGTWTAPVRINPAEPPFDANDALYPRLAVDGNNNLHVVFETKGSADSKINVYAVKGTKGAGNTWTWGAAADVSNDLGGQDSLYPDIAVDSAGIAHVVFEGKNAANGDGKINIYYSRDGGTGTWTTPAKITLEPPFDLNDALYPRIAVGASDSLHIVFESKAAGDSKINIYYIKGTKSGATWTFGSAKDVSNDLGGQDSLRPDVDVDSAGAAHIVFQGKSSANGDNRINIYYVTNKSGSFSTPKKVTLEPPFDAQDSLLPQITIGADDKAHIVFQGQTSFDSKKNVYYTTVDNGVVGTATNISKDLGNQDALAPDVAVSGSDVLVVFQGKDGSDIDIFASSSPLAAALGNLTNHLQASPTLVGNGDTVTVLQTLTSDTADTNLTPGTLSVVGASGANASCGSATLISADDDLDGTAGDAVVYRWTCTVSGGANVGSVTFKTTASGTSLAFAEATSNSVLVAPTLTFKVTVSGPPATVSIVKNTAIIRDDTVIPPTPSNEARTALGASIGDFVWSDLDGDGVQDVGEPGIGGVTVQVTGPGCAPCTAVTDGSGKYLVAGLAAGSYTVTYDPNTVPSGYLPSTPTALPVTLTAGQQVLTADFGLQPPGTASIGDTVWLDANNNGSLDGAEAGLPNITVKLYKDLTNNGLTGDDILMTTTTTDASGNYLFDNLRGGNYLVQVDTSSAVTSPYDGATTIAAAMAPTTGTTNPHDVTLSDGQAYTTADFGYNWGGSIGDTVWWDDDLGQDVDPGEGRIPDATVLLYFDANDNGVIDPSEYAAPVAYMDTDANGNYLFDNLPPGNYLVDVYEDSITSNGVRNIVPTTPDVRVVNLAPNQDVLTADFGYYVGALVEGNVFWDENHNGVLDAAEQDPTHLLENVTVTIVCLGPDGVAGGGDDYTRSMDTGTGGQPDGHFRFITPPGPCTLTYEQGDIPAVYGDRTTPISYTFIAEAGEDWRPAPPLDFGVDNSGKIGDRVWNDADGDGVQDAAEPGIAGVTVRLYDNTLTTLLNATVTDMFGVYAFIGLADGNYKVVVNPATLPTPPAGMNWDQTGDPDVNSPPACVGVACDDTGTGVVTGGGSDLTVDFGYRLEDGSGTGTSDNTIRGLIWEDTDGQGDPDEVNTQLANVLVTVNCGVNGVYVTLSTGTVSLGSNWEVTGIPNGSTCTVTVDTTTLPSPAFVQTGDPDVTSPPACSGAACDNKTVVSIPPAGGDVTGVDFGYQEKLGSISGTVCDGDGDGLCDDPGDTPLAGVTVFLRCVGADGFLGTADDIAQPAQTNASGDYTFTNLPPGQCQITQTNLPGYSSLADADGGNPDNISLVLGLGENKANQDFEDESTATGVIGDFAWIDTDGDNTFDVGVELPLNAVVIEVRNSSNVVVATVTTGPGGGFAPGQYLVSNLPAGAYTVTAVSWPLGFSYSGAPTLPNPRAVTLGPGQTDLTVDFPFISTTSVVATSFTAQVRNREMALRWETVIEQGNTGFHVQRAAAVAGPYEQLTSQPVPSQSVNGAGASYRWVDATAQRGVSYWYQLVTAPDGVVIGPVAAERAGTRVYLPVLSRSR